MFPERPFLRNRGQRSSALVITLAALVLLSAILLLFFDRSRLNRQISFSSAGQYRADRLTHTALDTITGDLRTEIIAGSTVTPAGPSNLYIPVTNFTMVPCRVEDQGFTNLVAQSASSSNFWTGGYYNTEFISPIRSAANNSTQAPSLNGRYIKPNLWNKPGLLGDPGSDVDPVVSANYIPPDWIVVTRQGPITNAAAYMPTLASLADKSPTNQNCAIGRYAYTIYNEGGLLDVNVAGFPSSQSGLSGTNFGAVRGLLPHVDLANLLTNPPISDSSPGDANALVSWRNQATGASSTSYTNYVAATTNGFTAVAVPPVAPSFGDQAFVTRQDLINFIKSSKVTTIPTSALPYLGTFTLDSDQPSYYPNPTNATNLNVLPIRVQTAFTRLSDNTASVVGEPLLKHRFPLSKLGLFQNSAANAGLIKQYFALQARSDGLWDYVDPDTGAVATTLPAIKTLDKIAGREPTFWELLQAGILTGSLGAESATNEGCFTTQNSLPTRQLLTIGLSIIDQYNAAGAPGTPTVINLGGMASPNPNNLFAAGVENLPYILWIAQQHFRDLITTGTPPSNSYIDGYLLFGLWNPHRNASSALAGNFRIVVSGATYITVKNSAASPPYNYTSPTVAHANSILQFQTTTGTSTPRNFSQIDVLRASDAILASTSNDMKFPPGAGSPRQVGLFMGQVNAPTVPDIVVSDSGTSLNMAYPQPINIVLETQVGGNWIPYQIFPSYSADWSNNGSNFDALTQEMNAGKFDGGTAAASTPPMVIAMVHSDPRTNRFGFNFGTYSTSGAPQLPAMIANTFNLITAAGSPIAFNSFGAANPTANCTIANYAYNQASVFNYPDPDGNIRKGDNNPSSSELSGDLHQADSPYPAASLDARPVMLNSPFASVAEMGFAFRDDPWRTLDFSSQYSADGGLLDLFSVNQTTSPNRAGVIDLNNASTEVLTAILLGAYRDPASSDGTPLTYEEATTIAGAVATVLRGPSASRSAPLMVLKNPADLTLLCDKVAGSLPDTFKFKREAFTRSFADVINTRTWDLMIDVVAQSGRYGATAKSLNDFTVEGERRYWVDVAIDRFTGEILGIQTDLVVD